MAGKSKGNQKSLHVAEEAVFKTAADPGKALDITKRLRKGHSLKPLLKEARDLIIDHNSAITYLCLAKVELAQAIDGLMNTSLTQLGVQPAIREEQKEHLQQAMSAARQGALQHSSLLCGRFYYRLAAVAAPNFASLKWAHVEALADPQTELLEQEPNLCDFERWNEWKHLTSQEVKLKMRVEMETVRKKGSLRQLKDAADVAEGIMCSGLLYKSLKLHLAHALDARDITLDKMLAQRQAYVVQELYRQRELTELVIDPTELQQLAQRFQYPEPADHQTVGNSKLDGLEEKHTRHKTADNMAMHRDLPVGVQYAALGSGSPVGAQLDKDKNYWRLLHRSQSEQDKDSSTVDKKRGGQEKTSSNEQGPEVAPTTSVYPGVEWNNPSCSLDPSTPTQPTPQMQTLKAREVAARQAAQQLLAEEDMAAAKAAAKKAKISRQKVKKQHAKGNQPGVQAADATGPEPTIQYSSPQQQGLQNSAVSSPLSQVSADEEHSAEVTSTQGSADAGSGFTSLLAHEIEHQISPVGPSSPPFSLVRTQIAHSPKSPGMNKGSPLDIHRLLCCPLTKVMMVDPVIAADGHTYERAAFQDWLQHSAMSPVDQVPLEHTHVITNQAIKKTLAVRWEHV